MISTITSRTGSYQSTPLVVRGEPVGELARRFVILGDVLYKRSFKGYSPFLILKSKGLASSFSFSYYFILYRRLPTLKTKPISKKKVNYTQLHLQIPFKGPWREQTLSPKTVKISVLTERFILLYMWFIFVDRIARLSWLTEDQPNLNEDRDTQLNLWTRVAFKHSFHQN